MRQGPADRNFTFFLYTKICKFIYHLNLSRKLMTQRTFWAILIQIMGVYVVLESLMAIPQFLITINYFFTSPTAREGSPIILYLICYVTITICIYILVIRYSIFKTDWVIDKLKLDTGYEDERLEFNIHRSTL